jgi:hypothetical protein
LTGKRFAEPRERPDADRQQRNGNVRRVKVTVVRSGGIAGFTTESSVDTETSKAEEASQLKQLVEEANLSAVSQPAPPPTKADQFQYEVTIHGDDGSKQMVAASEDQLPDSVRMLAEFVVARQPRPGL